MSLARRLTPARLLIAGALALAASLPGFWIAPGVYLAAYFAGWWLCVGVVMGGLVNVWVHNLTGGGWGEPMRPPVFRAAALLPVLALLFVPVLLGMNLLYPWAHDAAAGPARWAGEVSKPEFKSWWLTPWFFVARSIAYLVAWTVLGWLTRLPGWQRSRPLSAIGLVVYGLTVSLAGVDWIMSLVPVWYSTTFGLLLGTGQALAGTAFLVVYLALRPAPPQPHLFRDWGNLLLTYLLTWAYLAYTQYLIIWAENLPHEIEWYVRRIQTEWWWGGWCLILFHFFVPLVILLFRGVKQAPRLLGALAAALLAASLFEAWWLTLPSLETRTLHAWWFAPLAAIGLACLAGAAWWRPAEVRITPRPEGSDVKAHAHA